MHLKLNRGALIGNQWHEAGEVVAVPQASAERYVKRGAAVPHVPAVEQATAAPRSAERATAPRQR